MYSKFPKSKMGHILGDKSMPLYAIFRDKIKAEAFQDKIQKHLEATRERYNATNWSNTDQNKHPTKAEWKVPLHPEQLDLSGEDCTVVSDLPEEWTPKDEMVPK